MTYADAMARFGSDKPDLRFGLELTDLTSYFAGTEFRVFQAPYVGAVVMPGGAAQTRRELDAWQDWAKSRGARGLAYALIAQDGTISGPVGKNISESERAGLPAAVDASAGDAVFFAAGAARPSQELLGAARLEIGNRCGLIDTSAWSFLWVVDAPMFEETDAGGWTAVHHPFTSPLPGMVRQVRRRAGRRPGRRLRHGLQRLRDRRRLDPHPHAAPCSSRSSTSSACRRKRPVSVRLPARRLQVRPPAARRHGLRLGPGHHAASRRRHHPRRHRLPQGRERRRPANRRPHPHHPSPAQGSRHRRPPKARLTPA